MLWELKENVLSSIQVGKDHDVQKKIIVLVNRQNCNVTAVFRVLASPMSRAEVSVT